MHLHNLPNKHILPHTILICILCFAGCHNDVNKNKKLKLEDIFQNPPVSITSVTKSYVSKITTGAINDLNESILCMSTTIGEESNTYFIQPDKVELKDLTLKYSDAAIIDMQTALLIQDNESGKNTLFYLPGRFPIDSLESQPDVTIPVLGISKYHSEIEKISSRWTEIVCKCTDIQTDSTVYKERTIHNCYSGGPNQPECSLTTEGSVTTCQTQCKKGAVACCWFEF